MMRKLWFSLILVLLLADMSYAGRLYARKAGTESPLYNLRIENIRTHISIRNLLAITHVDEEFRNDETLDLEGFYVFQLPEGAQVDGLWLWIDGIKQTFMVKRKEEAIRIYDSLVTRGIGDPAILQSLGANKFQLKIFPIKAGSSRRIELQYFQTLTMNAQGLVRYYYPLNLSGYQPSVVQATDIQIDIKADFPIQKFTTNFDTRPLLLRLQTITPANYHIDFGAEDSKYTEDIVIEFSLDGWDGTFPTLGYAQKDTIDDGYFMMWNPMKIDPLETVRGDYVFVLDASGSMTGARIPAVKSACAYILHKLQPYDRFKFVLFSSKATGFPTDTSMLFATAENISLSLAVLDFMYQPEALTNYEAGITAGMKTSFRENADARMIFVTDGHANIGMRDQIGLRMLMRPFSGRAARFFPITIFTEKITLLYNLAGDCEGVFTNLELGEDLSTVLSRLAFDFTSTSISNLQLQMPSNFFHTYPLTFPVNAYPQQTVSAGRFFAEGQYPITLQYSRNSVRMSLDRQVTFSKDTSNPMQVARYWAAIRIAQLTKDMQATTNQALITELKESIIRLSEKFMILTPYTAFIVMKEENMNTEVNAEGTLPQQFELFQNYPNPFSATDGASTTIRILVPELATSLRTNVTLRIYDELGREVATLWDAPIGTGVHSFLWDGTNSLHERLAAGAYFCVMRVNGISKSIKIIITR